METRLLFFFLSPLKFLGVLLFLYTENNRFKVISLKMAKNKINRGWLREYSGLRSQRWEYSYFLPKSILLKDIAEPSHYFSLISEKQTWNQLFLINIIKVLKNVTSKTQFMPQIPMYINQSLKWHFWKGNWFGVLKMQNRVLPFA